MSKLFDGKIKLKSSHKKKRTVKKKVSSRFQRLEAMPCFEEIKDRIVAGWSSPKIANFIIEEKQDAFSELDISEVTLENWIYDYKKKIASTEIISRSPQALEKVEKRIEKTLDEVDELKDLYSIQKNRIDIDVGTEKKIGKLFKGTGQEIKIAADMLRASAEMKMDMGLVKRNLGKIELDQTLLADFSEKYGKKDLSNVLANPEKRRKIIGLVEMFMGEADGNPDFLRAIAEHAESLEEEPSE